MPLFWDVAIRTKLQRVITLTTVIALAVACSIIIGFQHLSYRRKVIQRTRSLAEIIAANSVAALSFHDPAAARETLQSLVTNPEIISARVHTLDGRVFAEYVRSGAVAPYGPAPKLVDGEEFDDNQLVLRQVIKLENDVLGLVSLRADMRIELQQLQWLTVVVLFCMALATIVAWGLAHRLQRFILDPILGLADLAKRVAATRDYNLRATPASHDEIGQLAGTFNDMLEQIQQRDREVSTAYDQLAKTTGNLQTSEERFRQLAENITEVFWMTNPDKTQMIYISPAYESLWGRTCASLYREPLTWAEAVHPEDRARVLSAVPQQSAGTYDIEYRIVRSSGSVRWIHDRAFPIRDANGKVYRVAGIAEDITARKAAEHALRLQAEIMTNMEEGVFLVRARDAAIVYANPKFERMFGYSPGGLIGQPVSVVNAGDPAAAAEMSQTIIAELNKTGRWSGEVRNRKQDGTEFWSYVNVSTFAHSEHGPVWVSIHADITKRKQVEAKYQLLVECVPAVTYTAELGAAGRWHFISPQIEPLLGFTPGEWMDDPGLWYRQVFPDDRPLALLHDEQAERSGQYNAEYRMLTRDGRTIWVRDTGVLLPPAAGSPPLLQGILHDITLRKLAEAALRESEERYRQLVEHAPDAIGVTIEGKIAFINSKGAKLLGVADAAQLFGRFFAEFVLPEELPLIRERVRAVLETQSPAPLAKYTIVRLDGTKVPVEVTATYITYQGVPAVQAVIRDVTARQQAEAALRESEQRLQAILDNSNAVIFLKDPDGRYLLINRLFEELFHFPREQIVGKTDYELFPPPVADGFRENDRRVLAEKKSLQFEERAPHDDGLHTYVSMKFPLFDATGEVFAICGISTDITERQRLERQILEVSDQVQRRIGLDLHDGLCQLLTGTGLASKGLESRLAAAGSPEMRAAREVTEMIDESVANARAVARGLHPVALDAGGLMSALCELADKAAAHDHVECRLECADEFALPAGPVALHVYRIAQEAVANALRHSGAGEIVLRLTRADGVIVLVVADNGRGLPVEPVEAAGMGLNIMGYRARLIGGTLSVQRGTTGGTVVRLTFPAG